MAARRGVLVLHVDHQPGSQHLAGRVEPHSGRVAHELGVQQEGGLAVTDAPIRIEVLSREVSVDRQLLDAASTDGADEVDGGRSATLDHPVHGCVVDLDLHEMVPSAGRDANQPASEVDEFPHERRG